MKQLHTFIFVLILSSFGQHATSQWYFETGVNDAKFTKYNDSNPTTLNSYTGLRDFSHAVGYIFPFKKLDERALSDAKTTALRFKIGLGFDQMNLRVKAVEKGSRALHHYDLGQLQGRVGLLFTPTLMRKKQADYLGVRQPAINLILDAGVSYNFYSSATRTLINGTGNITDLKVDNEFEQSFPAYTFGAGFEFPLSRHTALYAKYEVENTFSSKEGGNRGIVETFSTYKRRALIGLRIDFRLKNNLKRQQMDKIATAIDDIDALRQKVEELENAINSEHNHDDAKLQEHIQNKDIHGGTIYKTKLHDKGFTYLPKFKHVLFPLNSSHFNKEKYAPKLLDLATFLKQNPKYRLKLAGYADAETGSATYNKSLSAKRAKRIYDYLKNIGFTPSRMEHIGFGETKHFSIDNMADNRRTEIIIIE